MVHFGYPCPDCRSRNNLHEPGCEFTDRRRAAIERAYVEVLAPLSCEPMSESDLHEAVERWSPLHRAALARLREDHRVKENEAGLLVVVPPEERKERLREPTYEPLRTIYEKGSVPGAHDNSVFAMVAFYEMVGFTWPETKRLVVDWLKESGTWARGGFEESTPEELLESKRHVYEEGYGWKEKAKAAKAVIDRNV
ncbi:hypothetical protein BRC81_07650 [Halobacteriales archaeon QS_1_68_20]|nr:MAG: hypothetical protein BRC81_07650 [Halobacteriales archaeon QS_1_68_20]